VGVAQVHSAAPAGQAVFAQLASSFVQLQEIDGYVATTEENPAGYAPMLPSDGSPRSMIDRRSSLLLKDACYGYGSQPSKRRVVESFEEGPQVVLAETPAVEWQSYVVDGQLLEPDGTEHGAQTSGLEVPGFGHPAMQWRHVWQKRQALSVNLPTEHANRMRLDRKPAIRTGEAENPSPPQYTMHLGDHFLDGLNMLEHLDCQYDIERSVGKGKAGGRHLERWNAAIADDGQLAGFDIDAHNLAKLPREGGGVVCVAASDLQQPITDEPGVPAEN
jgi:hypothetical protein